MIVGIGTDVCSITRIQKSLERFGDRLVNRILTPAERPRFVGAKDKAGHLAKRFAAKEAFSKAIGTGIHGPFTWHSITVTRNPSGKPGIEPSPAMARHLKTLGVTGSHISLTDDGDVAMAFVVLEGKP
ncbi:MAG TPA: holo-ACP synthase [Usitatibacter sp.]|jgi:holo-[acyl-carrier protein] synthase|nr:holo-ACP synthase [Usitatibacter sp.]